ncbi:hypothetical protein OEZ86_004307 [Tetradesmus obliquus]|nr:hypothetical protein OEZ86_004307 [Tetradesmus obliquus]
MTQLTRLELPLQPGDSSSFSLLLQCLPDSLQELQLGADAAGQQDEGANAFEAAAAAEVLQGRQQLHFDLSHLTALTKLQLSAFAPVVTGDQLPRSLLQLQLRQCFDVQPLLQLSQLQAVALRPSTIPAHQLMELTQLTCLTSVQLFYEGGYQQCGSFTHWSGERLAEQAAVWAKLPLNSLGLYEGSGPYEGGEFDPLGRRPCTACVTQLQQLHRLTSLSLHWPLEVDVLTEIGQLQQLRCLSVRWDWFDEYLGSKWAERTPAELMECADMVLKVMHAFAGLPRLQELSWLCDEERDLCLSLAGLRNVLQQLGQRGQSSDGRLSVDELAGLVELHMEQCGD